MINITMNRANVSNLESYPEVLSLREVSEMLRISPITLRRWDNKGLLKAFRPSNKQQRRYLKKDVANFLQLSLPIAATTYTPLIKTSETLSDNEQADYVKANGEHYTPAILASFVAQHIVAEINKTNSESLRILDPAVGDGELLLPLASKLRSSQKTRLEIFGFDIKDKAIETAKERLLQQNTCDASTFLNTNFLEYALNKNNENLFDVIISNPPYVRTQVMGSAQSRALASQFGLGGRVDLYYAFLDGMSRVLKPNGIAGVIVSNKFMKTKSGMDVRARLADEFDVLHVWDFGDTHLFEAAVLPCVLLLRKKGGVTEANKPLFTSIYSVNKPDQDAPIYTDAIQALAHEGTVRVNDTFFQVQHGYLNPGHASEVWKLSTAKTDDWLQKVKKNTWGEFQDLGKIRVGVKTTADDVFIRDDWHELNSHEMPELLMRLTTHKIARQFKPLEASSEQLLYTHEIKNGKRRAVDIEKYPKSKSYLLRHKEKLESRKYVIEAGREWFEIWVPHSPELWKKPKIVFRDIVKEPTFWMDTEGTVVNGDCYWLTLNQEHDIDMLWLALAIGNSKFIEDFYDHKFNQKIYAGRRRFMTQYVKQFPLPDPNNKLSKEIIQISKSIFNSVSTKNIDGLKQNLNNLVYQSFSVT